MKRLSFFIMPLLLCVFFLSVSFASASSKESREHKVIVGIESFPEVFMPNLKSGSLVFTLGAQLFAGLTRYDEKGNIIPYLAKSWSVSDDKLCYTFHIKEKAYFHDNTPIYADDVAFSIETSIKNHSFSPFLDSISHIEILDKKTLNIHLKAPFPFLPKLLLPVFIPILPKHVYNGETDLRGSKAVLDVIGSGPFKLKTYTPDTQIILKKNENFFLEGLPLLHEIEFRTFLNNQEMSYALSSGDIDIISFFSNFEVVEFMNITHSDNYNFHASQNLHPYFMLTLNLNNKILANKKVRQALNIGLNREILANYFKHSSIKAMYAPIPEQSSFYSPIQAEYNVVKANTLLDEAGYVKDSSGKRFSMTIDYLDYPSNFLLVRWLQEEFSKNFGIELLTRNDIHPNSVEENIVSKNFDLFLDEVFAWNDPLIGLHRLYYSGNINKKIIWTNNSGYINPQIDALFLKANKEESPEQRKKIYEDIQKILAEDVASLWLCNNVYTVVSQKDIKNIHSLFYDLSSPLLEITREKH